MGTTVDTSARYLDQSGSPFERGVEHGRALAAEITALVEEICPQSWRTDKQIQWRLTRELRALEHFGAGEQLNELVGISVGSNVPFDDIARLNLIVGGDGVPGVDSVEGMYRPACTATAFTDPVLGRGCAKNGDAEAHHARWYWVQRVTPASRASRSYINVIWPGTIWTDSGMNDAGLAMVMTAGPGLLNQGLGLAGCVLPRVVLERASSVESAIDLLGRLPGSGYGLVYVLADPSGDCAVVEKVHDRMAVRGRDAPFVWAVNRFEDAQLVSEIVALPREGLDASNVERSTALMARDDSPPTSRQEAVRLLHTPPIHQRGTTSSYSVHTAAYACRDRELLVWGADIDEPPRSYRV